MKKLMTMVAAAVLLAACEPTVAFLEPQPVSTASAGSFAPEMGGWYQEEAHPNVKMFIGSDHVYVHERNESTVPRAQIENREGIWIRGNQIRIDSLDQQFAYRINPDSSYVLIQERTDTLFNISDGDVLKESDDMSYLNVQTAPNSWKVYLIRRSGGDAFSFCTISDKNDLEKLKSVTPVKEVINADSEMKEYVARPSDEEFAAFMERGGFSNQTVFRKVVETAGQNP